MQNTLDDPLITVRDERRIDIHQPHLSFDGPLMCRESHPAESGSSLR